MAPNEINFEKMFLILRLRAGLIAGIFVATVLVAAAITFQIPKMYQATASLNFDFNGNNPLDNRGRSVLSADSYLTTQVGILQSLNVSQQVVDTLTGYEKDRVIIALDASHSTIERFVYSVKQFIKSLFSVDSGTTKNVDSGTDGIINGGGQTLSVQTPYSSLTRMIGSDLEITPQINSRIVDVSYLSTDPKVAALLADRFAETYIATNLKMVIDPARKSKVWFDEQLKSLRALLEQSQAKLTAYQQKEGIVSSDERIDIESTKLRNLADRLVTAQQALRDSEAEKQKLEEVLARGDSLLTFEPVFNNSVVQRIKGEIRDLRGLLVKNSDSLGDNHPKIKRLKSEIEAARIRLENEISTIDDGISNAVDLTRDRVEDLEQAVAIQKQVVLKLKNERDKIVVFQREVDSAQAAYNAALKQLNTTTMQSMVDQTNVSIIDHASVPGIHATPRVAQNLALGAFGGLLFGIGFALFMEVFVRRVYSEQDLLDEIGVPLLGHLSKYQA